MKPMGGSEIVFNNLIKRLEPGWQEKVNLILSICNPQFIDPNKTNILLQQLSYDQQNVMYMQDSNFVDSIQHFTYVSNWQLEQFKQRFPIHNANNHVLKNAIDPILFKEKPKDKIRLIYTSMPNRGLEVLLDAFEMLNRDDVELIVHSSNVIYGSQYASAVNHDQLFERCKRMKNVIYKGYAMNNVIRKNLQEAHIWSYPNIFEETSCIAAIEAGSAGCKIVTTRHGALPETCDKFATYIDYNDDHKQLAKDYSVILNSTIDNYWNECYNLNEQVVWFNNTYSWENRIKEWQKLINNI
jgi:glycosyltransferase involved in cell wall biosynthesis